jgi:hypothetical protein
MDFDQVNREKRKLVISAYTYLETGHSLIALTTLRKLEVRPIDELCFSDGEISGQNNNV